MTLFQLCDPLTRLVPSKGNDSNLSHLKISSFRRAGSCWGLCLARTKTCAFLVGAAGLDPGAMRKLSELEHKKEIHMTIWSNHTVYAYFL